MRAFFAHARLGKLLAVVSVPLYAIDQATKWWAHYKVLDPIEVIPGFFHLVYWTNTGAAFGLGKDNNTFFVVLSAVAAGVIFALHRAKVLAGAWQRWGTALLLPGLVGNLTDRLWHGHVIDFLLFHYGTDGPAWPAFNVADSCICAAVGCFLWGNLRELRAESARGSAEADGAKAKTAE